MSFLARYASVRAVNRRAASPALPPKKRRASQPESGCAPPQVTCTMYASGIICACQADSLCAMIAAHQKNQFRAKEGLDPARNRRAASLTAAARVRFQRISRMSRM